MRGTRLISAGANTFPVHIDSFTDGDIAGAFIAPGMEEPCSFTSITGLILMIDEFLDAEEGADIIASPRVTADFEVGFEIEVMFRQNHCWQGRVILPKARKEATFRSVLELLAIIQTLYGD